MVRKRMKGKSKVEWLHQSTRLLRGDLKKGPTRGHGCFVDSMMKEMMKEMMMTKQDEEKDFWKRKRKRKRARGWTSRHCKPPR